MTETRRMISSGDISLESLYAEGQGKDAGLLLHPHPLYGGTMENNVVAALQTALNGVGWATLRYNSRGVGASGGRYDNGEEESVDLVRVAGHVSELLPGARLHVAAYSFGVWVAMKALAGRAWTPESMILVAPPLDFVSFEGLTLPPVPCLIVLGDADGFCSVTSLKRWLQSSDHEAGQAELEIIPRCDHFYWGQEERLSGIVAQFVGRLLSSSA